MRTVHAYREMPDAELFTVEAVDIVFPREDQPGRPVSRVPCARCGEGINDRREVYVGGEPVCRACAGDAYYRTVEKVQTRTMEPSMC